MTCKCFLNFINICLFLFIILFIFWFSYISFTNTNISLSIKIKDSSLQFLLFLSGISEYSPFSFTRSFSYIKYTTTDEINTYSLDVPSLQVNRTKDKINIRLYVPKIPFIKYKKIPVLIWLHGGCYIFGNISEYSIDNNAKLLSDILGIYIITIDYSLAPENKFPDALEDIYSVLYHLNDKKSDWINGKGKYNHLYPMNLQMIFIGGIGSGGNLALHGKLLWKDRYQNYKKQDKEDLLLFPHHHFYENINIDIIGEILIDPDLMQMNNSSDLSYYFLNYNTLNICRNLYFNDYFNEQYHLYSNIIYNINNHSTYNLYPFIFSSENSISYKQSSLLTQLLRNNNVIVSRTTIFHIPHIEHIINSNTKQSVYSGINTFIQKRINDLF